MADNPSLPHGRLGTEDRHLKNYELWDNLVNALAERQIGFRSVTESIDTTTSGGKLVFHVFGALAEFERGLIRERTQAGLVAARARGRVGGRPTVMTPDKIATAQQMCESKEYNRSDRQGRGCQPSLDLPPPRHERSAGERQRSR